MAVVNSLKSHSSAMPKLGLRSMVGGGSGGGSGTQKRKQTPLGIV